MHKLYLASRTVFDAPPAEAVRAAAAAGFHGLGLTVDPNDWSDRNTREVRAMLAGEGLELADVEVIRLAIGSLSEMHFKLIDIAAELGAPNIVLVSFDPDTDATYDKIATICQYAEPLGIRINIEMALVTSIGDIEDATNLIGRVRSPAAALLVDTLHIARANTSIDALRNIPSDLLVYVQFCDARINGPLAGDLTALYQEALEDRFNLGEGELPLGDYLNALPTNIPLSLEIPSRRLSKSFPDASQRAQVVFQHAAEFLARQGRMVAPIS